MTVERVRCLLANLPDGDNEIYFHPAAGRDADLDRLMPDYEHEAELAALLAVETTSALPGGTENLTYAKARRP